MEDADVKTVQELMTPILEHIKSESAAKTAREERTIVAFEANIAAQMQIADALQRIARCYERQMRMTQDPDTYSGPSRGFKPPIGGPPPNLGG